MNTPSIDTNRSNNNCEICSANGELHSLTVEPEARATGAAYALLCHTCLTNIDSPADHNMNHWHCLNDSMWSQEPAVQVLAWRLLKKLSSEPWAQDLLDMLYLEEPVRIWAEAGLLTEEEKAEVLDSNGAPLNAGDTVTVIKDLQVKGAGFTAKRGTAVRNISLTSNPEHIEGRVNGTKVVLLSKFVKKSN